MRPRPSHLRRPIVTLLLAAAGCAPSGGGAPGPPPGAGADPSGSWGVQMILASFAGACGGTSVQNVSWNFVPTGPDSWDVEMRDFNDLAVGTLQAQQVDDELLVSGRILGWGGVSVRDYKSTGLWATATALTGSMEVTYSGNYYCYRWGPTEGVRSTSSLEHAPEDPHELVPFARVLEVDLESASVKSRGVLLRRRQAAELAAQGPR